MNSKALRALGAALLLALGVWAGAHFRAARTVQRVDPTVKVAAGEASPPGPSDSPATEGGVRVHAIPERLPKFSLQDRAGNPTPIDSFAGKSLIINFWATWCAPCRSEIPLLMALDTEWAPRGMSVIGVAVDDRSKVLEFADRFKIGYPLLIGEQDALDAAAAFGVASPVFPFTVFTDRRGEVVALFIGELHRAQAELILGQVKSLDEHRVTLPDARRTIDVGLDALKTS
jgi:thiol-disulfide isomerase/thioredoxin